MRSFLQQVAQYYAATPHLEDLCFVFPNRRSGKFFELHLAEAVDKSVGKAVMMPRVMAMADFMADLTDYVQVSQLEAILVLYKAYRQVMGDSAAPMDTFVFWANLIINDFNDADVNLVDVKRLYMNLRDLREITTDYLDDDLRRDIERVLNISLPTHDGNDRFWRDWHSRDDDKEVRREFFSLWERLYDIYCTYHEMLAAQGLHTVGRIYRDAAQLVKSLPDERLPRRVVMVGFSTLSVSEMAVFKALKQRGLADFWWDLALDVLGNDDANPAGRMVREYAAMFAMPTALEPVCLDGKNVEAVAVPSTVGQAKWAFSRVDRLIDQGAITDTDNAINTAIVLPDESLFVPLINSVSRRIGRLNVTMGYPLRQANIVSLMHLVARAHKQSTRSQGEFVYYREDVKDIMSHPIIKMVFTQQALEVTNFITANNVWNVPASRLTEHGFGTLFHPLYDVTDSAQVVAYIDRLIDFCNTVNRQVMVNDQELPTDDTEQDDDLRAKLPLQSAFINLYVEALEQLKLGFAIHGIPVADVTLFYLIDRLTQTCVVPFEGEPLQGLQVMGLQETRSLDFDNIIILSMNERVFPRRNGISSLIPDQLRAAFYMLTSERQEAIAAYDFYRLIGRATNVVMVYSSAMGGVGSNEPSRFIGQLKLLYGSRITYTDYRVDTQVSTPSVVPIVVAKAVPPMHDYANPSVEALPAEAHCLSHSSIAKYFDCPLMFYFHHVEHLSDDSDKGDFMDYGTFGTIVHDTLQSLYYPDVIEGGECHRRWGEYVVTRQMIEAFMTSPKANEQSEMQRQVKHCINRLFLRHDDDAPLEGEGLIISETIETFVRRALDYDLQMLQDKQVDRLTVLECEKKHNVQLDMCGVKFNFTYKPDRVDRVAGQLRMVDYKTGDDPTGFKSLDDLFVTPPPGSKAKRRKAIAQLMLYCNAWHHEYPGDTVIKPVIYKLRKIEETGVYWGKDSLELDFGNDPKGINRDFCHRMAHRIGELLDCNVPFTQAEPGSKCCGYCRFADFCHR